MIIRPYQPSDLPSLKAITVEAFDGVSIDHGIERVFGEVNGRDWRWRKARHLDDDAARDPAGIFVAVVEDATPLCAGLLTPHNLATEGLPDSAGDLRSSARRGQETRAEQVIVGYITTWQDRAAGIGHIPNVAIRPEFRGAGLGRLLIEHVFAHFRAAGLTHAKIETLAQNAVGNHLYTSIGFQEVARQVHFVKEL